MEYNKIMSGEFYDYYTIEKGDTLYSISRKFNVNPALVAALNGLKDSEYIYPNQTLIIPKKSVVYYITKENDTLSDLESIFDVSNEILINQNKNIYLLPGQMIFYKENF